MKSSRCVLDDGVLEAGPDAVTIGRDEGHVLVGGGVQIGFGANGHLRADGLIQIGVGPLVRVELVAVAGQEERLDVGLVLAQAGLDRLAVMHAQVSRIR